MVPKEAGQEEELRAMTEAWGAGMGEDTWPVGNLPGEGSVGQKQSSLKVTGKCPGCCSLCGFQLCVCSESNAI